MSNLQSFAHLIGQTSIWLIACSTSHVYIYFFSKGSFVQQRNCQTNIDVCYDSSSRWIKYGIINQILDWPFCCGKFSSNLIGLLQATAESPMLNWYWEAIWERIEQPSLNKRGGLRFQLSNTWNQSLNDVTRRLSRHLPINTNSTSDSLQSPEEVQ